MPIRDFTELPGIFRFNLVWAPDDLTEADSRPSLQAALRDQLGLKLEKGTGPMPVLTIHKINRNPIEN